MIFDLTNIEDAVKFDNRVKILKQKKSTVEIKEKKKTRTLKQNSSIHLYCEMISDVLNELGHTFSFIGLKGVKMEIQYTPELIKSTLWKPIQMAMYNKESTTELTTTEVSEVAMQIECFFAGQGFDLPFPCIESL